MIWAFLKNNLKNMEVFHEKDIYFKQLQWVRGV